MLVADCVGPEVLGYSAKHQVRTRGIPGTGHSACRISNHGRTGLHETATDERRECEQDCGGITTGIGDKRRVLEMRAVQLGKTVGHNLRRMTGTQDGGEVNDARSGCADPYYPLR